MKTKSIYLTLFFVCIFNFGFTQKKAAPLSIIAGRVSISKYHNFESLKQLGKGDLLDLYIERIEVIVKILPNIAFATKPGVTLSSLGIPTSKDNLKALTNSHDASKNYFESTIEFQRKILPYSDKDDLIHAILFYENTLKSLHTYDDYRN